MRRFTNWVGFKRSGFPELEAPAYEDLPQEVVEDIAGGVSFDTHDEIAPTEPAQEIAPVRVPQREDFIAAFARLHMPTETRQILDVLEKGHTT